MEFFFRHNKIRAGQKDLVKDIFECISKKQHLIAHAPTGIGKTDAAISAVLPYAIENKKTVFFLTPKNTQHKIAVQVVKELSEKHKLNVFGTDLVGKKHLCVNKSLLEEGPENFYDLCQKMRKHESCPFYGYARGYSAQQKNVADNNFAEILKWYNIIREHSELKEYCESFGRTLMPKIPCAYEIALRLAEKSNIIIGDYYHLLNKDISKTILEKTKKSLEDCIIIVDEAHNAPARIRNSLSVSLDTFSLLKASKEAKLMHQASVSKFLQQISNEIKRLGAGIKKEKTIFHDSIPDMDSAMAEDIFELGLAYLERFKKPISNLCKVGQFYSAWNNESKSFLRILKKWERGEGFSVVYRCLDASVFTKDFLDMTHSTILMSGTLKPQAMYRDLLGLNDKRTVLKEYDSPFPKENRITIVDDSITTKYTQRTYENYEKIAKNCVKVINSVPGNVAIFFPSYFVLKEVSDALRELTNKTILVQQPDADLQKIKSQISQFKLMRDEGAVLLGVMGGRFSEGIDLPGRDLLGVIVVGIPFSTPDLETNALIKYYDHKFNKGWEYGYEYPALIKAIQAAGRCIRTEKDKGLIVFMDSRYTVPKYLSCIPKEYKTTITSDIPSAISPDFFAGVE